MTPSELELAARNRYNAIDDPHFSSAMIMDIIYQASMTLAVECFCIEQTYTTTSTSGTREYSYPSNAMSIRRVEYNGVKVIPSTLERDPKSNTSAPSGTPAEYAIWEDDIIFFPTPNATGDTVKVFTYNRPQAVTSSSTLEVPAEYHLDMIDLILSVMYAKDQNEGMATYHRNLWEKSINRIKRQRAKKLRGDMFMVVRDEAENPAHPGILL
jgi:hypothetical protein